MGNRGEEQRRRREQRRAARNRGAAEATVPHCSVHAAAGSVDRLRTRMKSLPRPWYFLKESGLAWVAALAWTALLLLLDLPLVLARC